jgi:indole-3-acetate monooxygenase
MAWGPGPGTAVMVDGGYRLTGRWSFASGCHHANWFGGMCTLVRPDGSEVRDAGGTPARPRLLFPASEAEITDVWQVSGLRGTGSDEYAVTDLFVPSDRAVPFWPQPAREPGPLYLFAAGGLGFTTAFAVGFSSVALGIAGGLLDTFLKLAITKTPRGMNGPLREQGAVQAQVGEAIATLASARTYLHQTIADVWEMASRTGELTLEQRVWIRLATTHAIQRATQVTDMVYHAAGATAIFNSQPFERRFRDAHAVSQQVQGRREHYETVGRYFMGLDTDLPWL